jgi:hypothetical protein
MAASTGSDPRGATARWSPAPERRAQLLVRRVAGGPEQRERVDAAWRKTDTRIGLLEFSSAAACAIPSPSAPSAGISYATWHLKHGRYMIYCSMPGHFQKGMHAHITVT